MTPVLGDPKCNGLPQGSVLAPVLFHLNSNDLPVTRGRKFIYAGQGQCLAIQGQYFSELDAVSRRIWCGCHTSVDIGDLNQAPPKQSAVCSTCIIPAPPLNCQFLRVASTFGMSATQPILPPNQPRPCAVLQRTLDEDCR